MQRPDCRGNITIHYAAVLAEAGKEVSVLKLVLKNKNDKYEIGEKIRDRRNTLGLSQHDVADILGIGDNSVSRYENGTREMSVSVFCQFVAALGAAPSDLLPDRLKKKPKSTCEKVMQIVSELPEEDQKYLLMLAERFKNGK